MKPINIFQGYVIRTILQLLTKHSNNGSQPQPNYSKVYQVSNVLQLQKGILIITIQLTQNSDQIPTEVYYPASILLLTGAQPSLPLKASTKVSPIDHLCFLVQISAQILN
jgi:hypothetical protein